MRTFRLLAVVGVVAMFVGCGGSKESEILQSELKAVQGKLDSVQAEIDTVYLSLKEQETARELEKMVVTTYSLAPIGNGTRVAGFNIATDEFLSGGVPRCDFYYIYKNGADERKRNVADLRNQTVELMMHKKSGFEVIVYDAKDYHYTSTRTDFSPNANADFKISLSYPTDKGNHYIIGAEDPRPQFADKADKVEIIPSPVVWAKLEYSLLSHKRVRISYNDSVGGFWVSSSYTTIKKESQPCDSTITGVPRWGVNFGNFCR